MAETSQENNPNSNALLLQLDSPKLVFYRKHAVEKMYHNCDHYEDSHGMVVRGLDIRHIQRQQNSGGDNKSNMENSVSKRAQKFLNRHSVNYSSRKQLINKDRFGLDDMTVGYSLSKKNRWELADYFEDNAKSYQHPDEKICTVLATNEIISSNWPTMIPNLFSGADPWRVRGYGKVKKLISSDENGQLTIRENSKSRGLVTTYILPLNFLSNQPSKLKPNRKMSKRQQRLAAAQCQEEPVLITYYLMDPKTTLNFMDSTAQSRLNITYEKCHRPPKKNRFPVENELECDQNSGYSYDFDALDFKNMENESLEDSLLADEYTAPSSMILGDFIDPDIMEFIQLASEFEFIEIHENFDIGDYVLFDD